MTDLTDELVGPIDAWMAQVDAADILDAPQDFLMAYGAVIRSVERLLAAEEPGDALSLLTALSACEFVMAEEPGWTQKVGLSPLQPLAPEWLLLLDDGSPEFRLAAAIGALRPLGASSADASRVRPFRCHLEPIAYRWEGDSTSVEWDWRATDDVVWDKEQDVDGLNAIASRRIKRWDGPATDFARGPIPARLADVDAFLRGRTEEAKLSRLCFSLSLIEAWRLSEDPFEDKSVEVEQLDPAFALARLAYAGRPLGPEGGPQIPLNRDIHLLADRGDADSTVEFARAHLRKFGYDAERDVEATDVDIRRLAAALCVPVSADALQALADHVGLRPT
jgi:CRISPR-associated protein Csx17